MKKTLYVLITFLCLGLIAVDADAARRFGGGGNLGRQRPAPTLRETPRETPAATAAPARPATPAAIPATGPVPKPSFMSRFGGVLAGLGIGALLGSLFSGGLGGAGGGLLMLLIVAVLAFALIRMFAGRRAATSDSMQATARPAFAGIGSAVNDPSHASEPSSVNEPLGVLPSGPEPAVLQESEVEPFLRVAKTSFIRLQAANDAGDLDDIRDYTTPEMYAEIAMQVRERAAQSQKSEVVALDAQLVNTGIDEPYAYASVRFKGELRDAPSGESEPFDEIWNVRRKLGDPRAPWLIAGIQQAA